MAIGRRGAEAREPAGSVAARFGIAGALGAAAALSALVNLLMLTGAVFMLEVYDRVLPSRSAATLVGLSIIALLLFALMGGLDAMRGRILARVGERIDAALSPTAFRAAIGDPAVERGRDGAQAVRDLDAVRGFLGGAGPGALFDLPWLPLYLLVAFAFHPLIGWTTAGGAAILVVLTLATERLSRRAAERAHEAGSRRSAVIEAARAEAEAVRAMGMGERLGARFLAAHDDHVSAQRAASDVVGGFGAATRTLRLVLQSAVLAVGAFLAIQDLVTPGVIIAAAIVAARALAPVEGAIANWRGFVAARQAWGRLRRGVAAVAETPARLPLPAPRASLLVEGLAVAPPGRATPTIADVSFALEAGQGLGVVGPSGSGKSTLARALVGAWAASRGEIRLDGAEIGQWAPEALGRHVGYLPQDVVLGEGTVAEIVSRFEPDPDPDAVIAAARAAGVHELVLSLPDGYDARLGPGGIALSAGQRQRVALARALYRDPFLVVLDEPNSNLDAPGEEALTRAILGVRARGGVVVVVAHRASAIAGVDLVLVLREGRREAFGPKAEVLARFTRPAAGLKVVEAQA